MAGLPCGPHCLWGAALLLAATASVARVTCGTEHHDIMHLQRLRKNLLCLYDRDAGPSVSPGNRTNVRYIFLRTRFDVDEAANALVLFGYIMFVWKDEWLHWDPQKYRNVSRVYVEADEIWTPTIATVENPTKVLGAGQALIMNGTVFWTMHAPLRAPCIHDPSSWPHDKMVCTITMVNLNPAVSMLEPRATQLNNVKWGNNQGWSMDKLRVKRMPKFAPMGFNDSVVLTFTMLRHVAKQESTTVWPVALQPVLLAASIGLPADSPHRPLLLCTLVLVQVLLSVVVPMGIVVVGDVAPRVVLLMRDLLVVTAVAVLEWTWARWMLSRPEPQPPSPSNALLDLADKLAVVLVLPGPGAPKAARTVVLVDRAFDVLLVVVCAVLLGRLLP
ncbi:neuronal acetylcholine receptor subunit alpha-10-like [Thrips palmi]|uniref:Neuronal acetylcholine receptor subunit alpha-10-like n=1 Tax=Thrips palmi TaxID=161013 RepID=A0A6P8YMG8_THRPL|nr:neuronal acetylcholine receptor subunit alpha-10-like [Thrips palmi]